ncbi:MAG TPA: hypothetical protein VFH06_01160 [Candidatus Saccharimonadales bacterium]|nr:hypothetical protein [Candidatus Saccharimonadales bacterium]
MSSLDDYYARQDGGKQERADDLHIRQYNRWVDIVLEAVREFARAAQTRPPATCEWVYENGQRTASWELLKEYDDTYRINLMQDGRLVYVKGSYYSLKPPPEGHVTNVIHLRHISHQSEEQAVGVGWSTLSDLCSNIVTSGYLRFHMPSPSHLHDDLLTHWSRTHPADDQSKR